MDQVNSDHTPRASIGPKTSALKSPLERREKGKQTGFSIESIERGRRKSKSVSDKMRD